MSFAERVPSQAWEWLALPSCPAFALWAWFKPESLPHGVAFRIPDGANWSIPDLSVHLTARNLLALAGMDPTTARAWTLYGATYESLGGTSPYLDSPIPPPHEGADPTLYVITHAGGPAPVGTATPMAQPDQFVPPAPEATTTGPLSTEESLHRIEVDWLATLDVEAELARLRRTLDDTRLRLKALNRDLSSDERLYSSPQEQKDWLSCRQALRDCELRITQCIKENDIGYATAAGQREWHEMVFESYVKAKVPFEGLDQAQRNFETYRKIITTLQGKMNSANQNALQQGERRARSLLSKVQAKIREAQTKRNMLGVMFD